MFSLCFSLLYQDQRLILPSGFPTLYYAIPFLVALVFIAGVLCQKTFNSNITKFPKFFRIILYLLALYVLLFPAFRFESIAWENTVHHWKAFLESAASVRAGGWLLWDTPSQYGFLQTLTIAFLPTPDCWQSLYLLNGSLQLLIGYGIFSILFARYRSIGGYIFSLSLAAACIMLTLPSTMTQEIYPSTGAMRFFWVYAMVGYVFFLCKPASLSRARLIIGHSLWLVGLLWAADSAIYITLVWLPSLVILAISEAAAEQSPPRLRILVRHIAARLLPAILMAAIVFVVILVAYWWHHQNLPDTELLTAYAVAYQTFLAHPIIALTILPCWLGIFYMLVMLLSNVLNNVAAGQQSGLRLAALYCAAFSIWTCASYYIPFSEPFHITGTMPLLVFVSALTLQLLPSLALPNGIKLAFEKGAFCLYAVVLLGTLSHFNYSMYTGRNLLFPIEPHVAHLLPPPPKELQELITEAAIPAGASVQIVYGERGVLEATSMPVKNMKPWLLPNTLVAFRIPLPAYLYQRAALRRAQTAEEIGWVIEADKFPLEALPWLNIAVTTYYTQTSYMQKGVWRIRKFTKIHPPE